MTIEPLAFEKTTHLFGLSAPSGGGKTFSALLFAAGLCDPGKKVGIIDTENKRTGYYAKNQQIIDAYDGKLPDRINLYAPFNPDRYVAAVNEFEASGQYGVCIIDQISYEWIGVGGTLETKENSKAGWLKASPPHKRMMMNFQFSSMHIVFILRAEEKYDVVDQGGKQKFIPLGLKPIQKDDFMFDLLACTMLDPVTKTPVASNSFHKVPADLQGIFQPGRHITKADGEIVRAWTNGGKVVDLHRERLFAELREACILGTAKMRNHWEGMAHSDQVLVGVDYKNECKKIAADADRVFADDAAAAVNTGEPAKNETDF